MSCADLAVLGARVRTLDPGRPAASAVAVRDGVIVAVGSDAEVRETCGAATEIIDGTGMALVPGLVDSHQHPFRGTVDTLGVDLSACTTLDEARAALAAERERAGPDGWVRGHQLEYALFEGSGGIHADLLEEAFAGAPALVTFPDLHTAVASHAALARAGIDGPREFTDQSEIVVDDHGTPTGELREFAAMDLVGDVMPEMAEEELRERYAATLQRMHAVGLTGMHAMLGDPELFDTVHAMEQAGQLTARVHLPLFLSPDMPDEQIDAWLTLRDDGGRRWSVGTVKFFIDGVVETSTAWLEEPDTAGGGTTSVWPDYGRYLDVVQRAVAAGWQCATHAIGDRAVRRVLDAYKLAGAPDGVRHRIEHLEVLADREIPRLSAENVVASMQPQHMQWASPAFDDPWSALLGPERAARGVRAGDVHRSGAVLALGSDWSVASYDPREGMMWARQRRAQHAAPETAFGPEQALDALATLHGYTTAPAYALSREAGAGRIAPGFLGDLTAFAEDPVDCPSDDLPDLPVRLTVVDGRAVFRGD
jgi:predicted amidohydrolase YtcJ